ncbi:pyridoxine [Rhizodiscina lignyota]|uniref:glutaminase n=1 Tax=Rhizodiscina lignyota TaxID=1504668 RepID=A0A9P4IRR2_9PEZI|nr:pyridoxine [Rhizodiscina lignyota]
MTLTQFARPVTVGVLALQGAFAEHILLLRQAANVLANGGIRRDAQWEFVEVRTRGELERCDALIIPGGESTTMSLVASRSGMLEPLREFVKVQRKPVWGTCAGLILLSESANRTKKGGQELIGGLDVRVNRNHFGRQVESFEADLDLPFLSDHTQKTAANENGHTETKSTPFHTIFIRAPVVERILQHQPGAQLEEASKDDTVVAPSREPASLSAKAAMVSEVEILTRLPPSAPSLDRQGITAKDVGEDGDIVAVRQGNCFGTAFHPELTGDARIHVWWLGEVLESVERREGERQIS